MTTSHCLPSGALGTAEISVPNVSAAAVRTDLPTGNRRGVVVFMHGLSVAPQPVPPAAIIDEPPFGYPGSFKDACTSDGWIFMVPPYPEDLQPGYPAQAIKDDMTTDGGARHLTTVLHWWDHIVDYIHRTYGTNYPIMAAGVSWGGWHAIQVAKNRASDIVAYCAFLPVTKVSDIASAWSNPVDLTTISTTGADTGVHALDAVGKLGYVCYHTDDTVVGGGTGANSNSVNLCANAVSAGQSITVRSATGGHFFLSADKDSAVAWVQGTAVRAAAPRTLT